jgi:hypothetical protein
MSDSYGGGQAFGNGAPDDGSVAAFGEVDAAQKQQQQAQMAFDTGRARRNLIQGLTAKKADKGRALRQAALAGSLEGQAPQQP